MPDLTDLGVAVGSPPDIHGSDGVSDKATDWLSFLKKELQSPCLQWLTFYLETTNGFKRKTTASCLSEFRAKYPKSFKAMALFDLGFRMASISFILLVAARGLGIEGSIKGVFDYIGHAMIYLKTMFG